MCSKRAVKRVKKRIDVIGKKKQAVVRFLKKDVADLLAAGHDSNAFGRVCMRYLSIPFLTMSWVV